MAGRPRAFAEALLAGSACASAAAAQPADPPPPVAEPASEAAIIITGSRIPQPNLTAVSPVTVVGREEVALQGTTRAEDLINSFPQAFGDQGGNISNGATGTASVNLRGLGPSRTLVLINGRRLLPGDPSGPAPDLNAVPAALIERVDILTGGASSVYGSDALAGVVNFILDTDLDGFRLDAQSSLYSHDNDDGSDIVQALERRRFAVPRGTVTDGFGIDVNAAAGTGFGGGRGHATVYAGYRKIDEVVQDSRDYSACATSGRATSDIFDCGGSSTSSNAAFSTNFAVFQTGAGRTFVPGTTQFNFAPFNYFQRPDERYIAGGFVRYEISRAVRPYAEIMYMDDRSVAQVAPSANFGNTNTINCDNPLLSAQQRSRTCFNGNFVGQVPVFDRTGRLVSIEGTPTPFVDPVTGATYLRGVLNARRRNVEGGPRQSDLRHDNLRALGGVRGDIGAAWSWDAYYLYGRVRSEDLFTGDLSITRLRRAVDVVVGPNGQPVCRSVLTGEDPDCLPFDIFDVGGVTPAAAEYLELPAGRRGTVKQRVAFASATGQLGGYGIRSPWADEGVAVNLGVEYREDSLDFRPDPVFASGDLAGQGEPSPPLDGGFDVFELFSETRVPILADRLVHDLTVEAGYRFSQYDNGESSFSTDTYKFGIDLAPVRDLRLRASYNRAVRAPNVQELFTPQFLSLAVPFDPCAGVAPSASATQCALTGVSAAQYGRILANPAAAQIDGGYNARQGGNPDLEPERATTKSAGVVLRPRFLPRFAATVDWFDIRIKGTIQPIVPVLIVITCFETGDPAFCGRFNRDANGSLWLTPQGFVDATNTNIGSLATRGIDVGASYRLDLGRLGRLDADLAGTWLDKLQTDNGGLATPFDCAGLYGQQCGTPKPEWRHKLRLTWTLDGGAALSLQWRHFDSVRIDLASREPSLESGITPRDERIPAQDYFDLTATFRAGRGYVFRLGAKNILDREPPVIAASGAGFTAGCAAPGCSGNTFPQVYDALGRYLFGGVTVDF